MSTCVATSVDVALLGCGNVGSALARLAGTQHPSHARFRITGALVRDPGRMRVLPSSVPLTTDARTLLTPRPDVIVELLGGVEPARSVVLAALERRIPVVTANKTLLARHGGQLRAAAAAAGTPLLVEAAVLAGVPFLGTFARRPLAARASSFVGIANGTTNFILTRCASDACTFADALGEAQRLGYAEPDPRSDITGIDAAEKLAVLLQHFAGREIHPDTIETAGIDRLTPAQTAHARELGGVVKPVVFAAWASRVEAFAGPAFVPTAHALSRVDGVENALILENTRGRLLFQGPGAGSDVTAATVLDDVREIADGVAPLAQPPLTAADAGAPETAWMLTLEGVRVPRAAEVSDFLASHNIFAYRVSARRSSGGRESQSLLVWPVRRAPLQVALDALARATDCTVGSLRALEDGR